MIGNKFLFNTKLNRVRHPASIFEEILIFSLTAEEKQFKAYENIFVRRSKFKMIFNFLFDAEYREVEERSDVSVL